MPAWGSAAGGLSEEEIRRLTVLHPWPGGLRLAETAPVDARRSRHRHVRHRARRALFLKNCSGCHGTGGEGKIAPSLNNHVLRTLASDAFLAQTIASGRRNTAMPAYGAVTGGLTDRDIGDLIAHVRSLRQRRGMHGRQEDSHRRSFLQLGTGLGVALTGIFGRSVTRARRVRGGRRRSPAKLSLPRLGGSLPASSSSWDRVVRSTHSANCTGSCSWKVYVKDGVMLREEQAADYPRINQELPDYNPRGCQKGACFVEYVYGAQRVKYPLIRAGERGEGKWRRATLGRGARAASPASCSTTSTSTAPTRTPSSRSSRRCRPVSFCAGVAPRALSSGGVFCSFYDWYCDLPPGEPITWGVQTEACECADWFNAKHIVLWGSNINATRIPDAHFAWEARYNGATIACVSPDYNASAIHCRPVRVDPARARTPSWPSAVCRWLIENGGIDVPVREGADRSAATRPVRTTGSSCAASDLAQANRGEAPTPRPGTRGRRRRGSPRARRRPGRLRSRRSAPTRSSMSIDARAGKIAQVPGSMGSTAASIALGKVDPALEGRWTVTLVDGRVVEVTTVFERLKASLAGAQLLDQRGGAGVRNR